MNLKLPLIYVIMPDYEKKKKEEVVRHSTTVS